MNKPLFSVIVPIYDIEKYIRECIESVLAQSCDDFELILVDDGSKDDCGKICDEYAVLDERIIVIHKENGGLVSARKAGANLAKGRYVVALDGDDYMAENALEELAEIIHKQNPDVISFGFYFKWSDKQIVWDTNFDEGLYLGEKLDTLKGKLYYDNSMPFYTFGVSPSICSKAIKTELYKKHQLSLNNLIKMGEDLGVTMPVFFEAKKVYVLKKPLMYYRQLGNSISHSFRKNDVSDLNHLLAHLDEVLDFNRYSIKKQVGAYTLFRLHSFLASAAREMDNFNDYMSLLDGVDSIHLRIKSLNYSDVDFKMRMVLFAIKHKAWRVFWIFYHRIK